MAFVCESLITKVTSLFDVLVAGGGVAGIAAALAAARQGKKVILLEKQFTLGGLATAGLITYYLPLCDGKGNQVSYGIAEELLRLSIKYGYEAEYPAEWLENGSKESRMKHRFRVRYNAHLFAIAAEQLLLQEGVKILYGTSVCAVAKDNNKIHAVIIENKSGRSGIAVKTVVDATGDADICAFAGEKTALFGAGNILAAWHYYVGENGYELKTLGAAEIPEEDRTEETVPLIPKRFQGVDGEELSEMVQCSHRQILKEILREKKKDPGHMPVTIAAVPQIRMTRRLEGCFRMDTSDEKTTFEDSVGLFGNWKKSGPIYELPFRALYGETVNNLITAGRCISVTDAMWDVTRVIPVCAVSGEAAGTAAALTDNFAELDVKVLQEALKRRGVRLSRNEIR